MCYTRCHLKTDNFADVKMDASVFHIARTASWTLFCVVRHFLVGLHEKWRRPWKMTSLPRIDAFRAVSPLFMDLLLEGPTFIKPCLQNRLS